MSSFLSLPGEDATNPAAPTRQTATPFADATSAANNTQGSVVSAVLQHVRAAVVFGPWFKCSLWMNKRYQFNPLPCTSISKPYLPCTDQWQVFARPHILCAMLSLECQRIAHEALRFTQATVSYHMAASLGLPSLPRILCTSELNALYHTTTGPHACGSTASMATKPDPHLSPSA